MFRRIFLQCVRQRLELKTALLLCGLVIKHFPVLSQIGRNQCDQPHRRDQRLLGELHLIQIPVAAAHRQLAVRLVAEHGQLLLVKLRQCRRRFGSGQGSKLIPEQREPAAGIQEAAAAFRQPCGQFAEFRRIGKARRALIRQIVEHILTRIEVEPAVVEMQLRAPTDAEPVQRPENDPVLPAHGSRHQLGDSGQIAEKPAAGIGQRNQQPYAFERIGGSIPVRGHQNAPFTGNSGQQRLQRRFEDGIGQFVPLPGSRLKLLQRPGQHHRLQRQVGSEHGIGRQRPELLPERPVSAAGQPPQKSLRFTRQRQEHTVFKETGLPFQRYGTGAAGGKFVNPGQCPSQRKRGAELLEFAHELRRQLAVRRRQRKLQAVEQPFQRCEQPHRI